jgi:tetratricopeptide (TPR) repeat protein
VNIDLDVSLRAADWQARILGNLKRAQEIITDARQQATDAERRFLLRRMTRWIDTKLEAATRRPAPEVGAIESVLVDADDSGEGFLVRIRVVEGLDQVESAGVSFRAALDRARRLALRLLTASGVFRADAELLRRSGFVLEPRATALFRVEGGSLAAAAAVALVSQWTGRPVSPGVVVTGCLEEDGALRPVAGLEAKVAAVLRERPTVNRLVVPAEQLEEAAAAAPRVVGAETFEDLAGQVLELDLAASGPRAATVDVEGTVRLGLSLYEKQGSFALAHDVLTTALSAIEVRRARRRDQMLYRVEEFLALWRAGSCLVHQGDPEGAARLFERAAALGEALWQGREIDPKAYLGFRGNHAVLLRDRFEYEAAERVLLDNLAQQKALRQDRREVAKTHGNLGELWTFMDRFDEAEAALGDALASLRAVYPDEVPRELCYLGNLYLRRGDPARARAHYADGLSSNETASYGRDRNEAFLRYGLVRAHLKLSQPDEAIRHADKALAILSPTELYPRQMILKYRGLAHLALGEEAQGEDDLKAAADLTFASGPLAELAAGTALAEHALFLLQKPGEEARARELVEEARKRGGDLMERLLLRVKTPFHGAEEQLQCVVDLFPY